ncbi:hypothetical protein ACFL0Y_03855 [Patescibacteria group bacterium]
MLLNQTVFFIVLALVFVWLSVLTFGLVRFYYHYRKLTKGVAKKDLRSVLEKLLKDLGQESVKINAAVKEIEFNPGVIWFEMVPLGKEITY